MPTQWRADIGLHDRERAVRFRNYRHPFAVGIAPTFLHARSGGAQQNSPVIIKGRRLTAQTHGCCCSVRIDRPSSAADFGSPEVAPSIRVVTSDVAVALIRGGVVMRKHSMLRQWELDALLAWLAPTREQAGEKYESIRQKLTRYFECRNCIPADEHADETIDRVARRLASGERIRCTNRYRYFQGVARNISLELRKQKAHEAQLRWRVAAVPEHDSPRTVCLQRCLSALSAGARELLEGYYQDGRLELPARLGITPNAVRLRVFKEKQKLKSCIDRCVKLHEGLITRVHPLSPRKYSARNGH
jgi:hypothetical protein